MPILEITKNFAYIKNIFCSLSKYFIICPNFFFLILEIDIKIKCILLINLYYLNNLVHKFKIYSIYLH